MGLFDRLRRRPEPDEPDPPELPDLIAQLADPDASRRLAAARALGDLGQRARSAVPALEERIDDEDGDVCNAAADALSRIERGF